MKIDVKHERAIMGHDIVVSVEAETEKITSVDVQLDGFSIGSDALATASDSYQREFHQVGDARPGMEHTLIVSVVTAESETHDSTARWVDA